MECGKGKKRWLYALRGALTLSCVAMLLFIFANSLQSGEESSALSLSVTIGVQKFFRVIAPSSFIATATGEAFELLHSALRLLAHFCEFALFGARVIWCCRSYTDKKAYFLIPVALVLFVPIIDELLQKFSNGRVADVQDVLIDVLGGVCGALFAAFTLFIGMKIYRRKRAKGV